MPFIENHVEFAARHGGNPVYHNGVYRLPDGAWMEREFSSYALHEPSPDPSRRAEAVLVYWDVKLKRAQEDFYQIKEGLTRMANARAKDGLPPPDHIDLAHLKRAEKAVKEMQQRHAEAKAAYDETPAAQAAAKRERQRAEALAREQEFL